MDHMHNSGAYDSSKYEDPNANPFGSNGRAIQNSPPRGGGGLQHSPPRGGGGDRGRPSPISSQPK